MLKRQFGKTNISMSVLTCGGMRFQQSWNHADNVQPTNQSNLESTVRRALEVGINHIETARGYGTSEKQLGQILPKLPRQDFILQTKIAPTEDPAQFELDFFDSLDRLSVKNVDLLAIHGVNDEETLRQTLREGGALERALKFKERGIVRAVGFATHGPLDIILKAVLDGRFDYVNLHYYWAMQQNLRAIREAAARNMGILVISPNDKGGRLYDPPAKLVELTAPLSPMIFNDLFCLAHPEITTISIGVARPSDFDAHVRAQALLAEQGSDARRIVAPIEARLTEEAERVLGRDWATTWQDGLPQYQDIPGKINVREILRLYNLARSFDLVEYGKMRYNLFENGGHWFPGHPAKDFDDAQMMAALSGSPHASKIPAILREAHALFEGAKLKRLQQG